MKKVEEILKALRLCSEKDCCEDCAYFPSDTMCKELYMDAKRTIVRLLDEKKLHRITLDLYGGEEGINALYRENEELKDQLRALKTELQVNGKKPDTLCPANESGPDQTAKQDNGKLDPTLVPTDIIWAIAAVRREGLKKYKDKFNYRQVEKERLRAAAFRHFLKYLKDPSVMDEETGLPHLWHCCTNLAFLCEMEGREDGKVR